METVKAAWASILDVWKSGQVGLPKVVRWKKYLEADEGIRHQNSMEHSYGIAVLGRIFVELMKPHLRLDGDLLVTALLLHDHGEGEVGSDTLYIDKTAKGDLAEYFGFRRRFEQLGPAFDAMHGAFLLQFVFKDRAGLPDDARAIVDALAVAKKWEAQAFDALERWDYVLFAFEQYLERGNARILTHVLRNECPHLDRLARDFYGFRQTIWTDEIAAECRAFLEAHADIDREKGVNVTPSPAVK